MIVWRRREAWLLGAGLALWGALWAVLHIGSEVREGETGAIDRAILLGFRISGHPDQLRGPRWIQESARDVTALGGFTVLTIITLAALAVMLNYGRRLQALVFGCVVLGAQITAEVIKHFVARPRPDLVAHFDLTYSSSFPSGHSVMAPVVYFTLAAIISAGEVRSAARVLLIAGSVSIVVAVGVSRVYLGVHWPTDVLGGWALGSGIALAAWALLDAMQSVPPGNTGRGVRSLRPRSSDVDEPSLPSET